MRLFYAGRDITEHVGILSAVHTDSSDGRRDMLEIDFETPEKWFGWQPQKDDQIRIVQDGYDTGLLYVTALWPNNGVYRMIATGAKCASRIKGSYVYEGKSLARIMMLCAAECGMEQGLYGFENDYGYDCLIRSDEGCTAFLSRLLTMEGACLKTMGGKFRGISIDYAQSMNAVQTITLDGNRFNAEYVARNDKKLRKVTVISAYASASAVDTGAADDSETTIALPARDVTTAGRWARGWLLDNNRHSEELTMTFDFNPGLTALGRIDIESSTALAGKWLIDEAVHDLIDLKSTVKMLRCVDTVR